MSVLTPASPRTRRGLALVLAILTLAGVLGVARQALAAQGRSSAAAFAPQYYDNMIVRDDFSRYVRSGWGRPMHGGWYRADDVSGTSRVQDGAGQVVGVRPGAAAEFHLSAVDVTDTFVQSTISLPRLPSGGGAYLALEMRVLPDSSAYTVTLHVASDARATLLVAHRYADGSGTMLASRRLGKILPRARYALQGAVRGNQVWGRAWRIIAAAPRWTTATDPQPLTRAGSIGFIVYQAAGGHPLSAQLLALWAHGHRGRVPTPPTQPAPTTPAPTTPTTPAPTPSPTTPAPTPTDPTTPAPTDQPTTPAPTTPTTPAPTTPAPTTPAPTTPAPTTPAPTPAPTNPAPAPNAVPAGAAPLGTTSYPVPANSVFVATNGNDSTGTGAMSSPFATVKRALDKVTTGGTIVVRGGTYHQNTLVMPGTDVTIESYPGEVVWFDGSVPVSGWFASNGDWVHSGWTAEFDHSASFDFGSDAGDFINPAYPLAAHPDQVFVDGVQLVQVASNPAPGQFAVDYNANTLTLGSDPTGHDVRASDLTQAFVVGGKVTLRGFGVRRYATPLPLIGTIYFGGNTGHSTVENVIITDNATVGLSSSTPGEIFNHVTASNNGMTGIGAEHDDGGIIENSLLSGNNTQHFNSAPAAGGMKVGRVNGITIRDNLVENNLAVSGIWTDENTINFVITGNVVRNNGPEYGIENELSDTGIVANNTITGSRYGWTAFDSGHIKVYNNTITNNSVWDVGLTQDNRYQPGMGTAGPNVQPSAADPWLCDYVSVVNNNFGTADGGFQFYALDKQTGRPASSMHIYIAGNMFQPKIAQRDPVAIGWGGADNSTVTYYATPDAFTRAMGVSWQNWTPQTASASTMNLGGLALPSDVATAIGAPVGSTHIGAY